MIRIGIAGCGLIGTAHAWSLWALRQAGLAEAAVTKVFDVDPGRAAQMASNQDAKVAADEDSLLEEIDALWVCTPTALHRGWAEAAADRALAVFCEKPLGPNLEEARRVAAALARVPHQVGLVMRYAPVFGRLSELLASGTYGRILAAILRDDQYFPIREHYASTWRSERDAAGGGTLIEHSIHDVDLLRWLLTDPAEVACRTSSFFGYRGIEDLGTVTLTYKSGAAASLISVWHQIMSRGSTRRLEVFCENALLWTDDDYIGPVAHRDQRRTRGDLVFAPRLGCRSGGARGSTPADWVLRLGEQTLHRVPCGGQRGIPGGRGGYGGPPDHRRRVPVGRERRKAGGGRRA